MDHTVGLGRTSADFFGVEFSLSMVVNWNVHCRGERIGWSNLGFGGNFQILLSAFTNFLHWNYT